MKFLGKCFAWTPLSSAIKSTQRQCGNLIAVREPAPSPE
jgi:hypothetical protein